MEEGNDMIKRSCSGMVFEQSVKEERKMLLSYACADPFERSARAHVSTDKTLGWPKSDLGLVWVKSWILDLASNFWP